MRPYSQSDQSSPRPARQIILILFTAAISFVLGIVVGRSSAPVQQIVKVTMPAASTNGQSLTFYKTLPKGETSALGTGINHGTTAGSPVPSVTRPAAPETATKGETPTTNIKSVGAPDLAKKNQGDRNKSNGGWLLQAASNPREKDAQALAKRLNAKGYKTTVESVIIKGKTWYRVYVGPYANQSTAKEAAAKLSRQEKIAPIARQL